MGTVLLLLGCPGDDDTASPDSGHFVAACLEDPAGLELGTGIADVTPIGASLAMVHGQQGGWHITASVRVANLGSIVTVEVRATDDQTGEAVSHAEAIRVKLVPDVACGGVFAGIQAVLDHRLVGGENVPKSQLPKVLSCRDITLHACATEAGREACSVSSFRLLPDPADVEDGLLHACP